MVSQQCHLSDIGMVKRVGAADRGKYLHKDHGLRSHGIAQMSAQNMSQDFLCDLTGRCIYTCTCFGSRLLCCVEEECGSTIVDCLTAPRDSLLSMLAPAQASSPTSTPLAGPPGRPPLQQTGNNSASTSAQAGGPAAGCVSLSELSVSDPGMKEPQAWWSQVQLVLPALHFPCIACGEHSCWCCASGVRHPAVVSGYAHRMTWSYKPCCT